MLQSIKEGVVAVDDRGEVTLINDAAQELLNYRKSQDDEKLSTLSHSWSQVVDVSEVLRDGTPRRDEEITIKDRLLLINTVRCAVMALSSVPFQPSGTKLKFVN